MIQVIDKYDMAYVAMLILNSVKVQEFLKSIAFLDAKRPFTKKVLERIDFHKIVRSLTVEELAETERFLNLTGYITDTRYEEFKTVVMAGQMSFL